jgi:hemoglobin/transferrin/lactoferrin receptor protein
MVTNANDVLQTPTGYNQLNITENLAWKASDLLTLKYGGIFTTSSDIPRYDRLQEKIDTLPRFAEWYYGPQFWTMHSLTASLSDAGFLGDAAPITASFQYYNESRNDRRFNNASKRNQDETVVIGAINADMRVHLGGDQFTNDMATATSSSHLERELYYGIEAYFNDVTSEATRTNILTNVVTPTQTRYPDGGSMITSGAAYAQVRWATSEALTLAGGLRFTYYDLQSTLKDTATLSLPFTDLSMSTSAITGSVGATWRVAPSLTVHANMSSGFRAPNLDDVAKVFESAPGKLVVPNPELGPEYAYTLEGGFTWSAAQWLRAEINAFRTWSIDAVQQRPFTLNGKDTVYIDGTPWAVVANQNVGQANIYGASAEVNASIGQLEACATGVYAYGTVADTNLPLGKMPPVYGSVRATWHQDAFMFGAQFWWMATKPFGEIPADGERVIGINTTPDGNPAWQRVDLSAGWRPSSMFEIRAILENLLDAQYRPYSSGVSAPGRNLVVSVRANM